jgi:uncharacterized protein (DUF58 family)
VIEIRSPKLKDYFSYNRSWTSPTEFYYYNQTIFNKLSLAVLFILINLLFGFSNKTCLTLAISSSFFLCYLYFKTQKESQNIFIIRKTPHHAREYDQIKIEYEFYNSSSFEIENFVVKDSFNGTKSKNVTIPFPSIVSKTSILKSNKIIVLDSGMGTKKFGPLTITISDPLGFFEFQIIDTKEVEIKIYPHIETIQKMKLKGDIYALQYGLYDTPSRGDTTNFIGVKPYRPGDSIKKINWKLTLKNKKTIINEFEKNVNTTLSMILNLDSKLHMGKENLSTWEYAKDISLALASQQISNGNAVQFFSNDIYVESGMGQAHINFLELIICTLELSQTTQGNLLVNKSIPSISTESKVVYITPVYPSHLFDENLQTLKNFSQFNNNIHVILIDGTHELSTMLSGNSNFEIKSILLGAKQLAESKCIELKNHGISTSIIPISSTIPYQKQLMKCFNNNMDIMID